MKRILKRLCIALAVLIVIGSGVVVWKLWPRTKVLLTDADAIRVPSDGAAVRDVLWRPAEALPGLINTADDDYEAEISEDGMTLFFVRGRPGKNADIFVCQKADTGWGDPHPLGNVNSEYDDLGPELSADGRTLYFYSNREGSLGGFDLWMARRGESGWREPVNLGRAVNSPFDDYGPALSPDQGQLYFASNRPRPDDAQPLDPDTWRATLRVDRQQRDFDLYATSLADAGPQPAVPILEVNTPFDEGTPTLSPFGDFLYFASNRPGGSAVLISTDRAAFAAPMNRPPISATPSTQSPTRWTPS
ncbi:MAG: PD40 domain-containing protein [Planctomycetes bacterium]|nr:PD40 domain-containing protein [Planctomycetota bacterium]